MNLKELVKQFEMNSLDKKLETTFSESMSAIENSDYPDKAQLAAAVAGAAYDMQNFMVYIGCGRANDAITREDFVDAAVKMCTGEKTDTEVFRQWEAEGKRPEWVTKEEMKKNLGVTL